MEPLNNNIPYIDSTGKRSTLGAEIGGGGGGYTLPTASSDTKGGVKIGSGLSMTGETLSANAQVPAHSSSEAGKVLSVDDSGNLVWATVSGGSFARAVVPASANVKITSMEVE